MELQAHSLCPTVFYNPPSEYSENISVLTMLYLASSLGCELEYDMVNTIITTYHDAANVSYVRFVFNDRTVKMSDVPKLSKMSEMHKLYKLSKVSQMPKLSMALGTSEIPQKSKMS